MAANITTLFSEPVALAPTTASDFIDAARLEFHAAAQLLAERACFLTAASGCAIALEENGVFIYCAATGTSQREPGNEAPSDVKGIRECFASRRPTLVSSSEKVPSSFTLFVPIVSENKASGFLELISQYEFPRDIDSALMRIADLVGVARDLRRAAENSSREIFRERPTPALLRSIEEVSSAKLAEKVQSAASANSLAVHICSSCGFPISGRRTLCVECDEKSDAPRPAPAGLFSAEKQESWWSAHGYTIASILVTVITAAIVLWLRR